MNKINLLHLIDSSGMYGAEKVILTLLENLNDPNIKCILGCIRESKNQEVELALKAKNIRQTVVYFNMMRGLNLKGLFQLYLYIRNNKIHLIHSHGFKPNIMLGMLKPFLKKVKIITTVHGWAKQYGDKKLKIYEKLNCIFIKRFSSCVAVSNGVYKDLIKSFKPVNPIIIIYNGIDIKLKISDVDKYKIRNKYKIPNNCFLIGTACRLVEEKGIDVFIKAAHHFLENNQNTLFLIAGTGPLKKKLEKQAKKYGCDDKISFLGYVHEIYDYISILDIFVLASYTEGLPMVLLEAMNLGCPTISTNVGGIPEVIEHDKDGILIEAGDAKNLCKSYEKLYHSEIHRQNLAVNAQTKASIMFSAKNMANKYTKLYKKLGGVDSKL